MYSYHYIFIAALTLNLIQLSLSYETADPELMSSLNILYQILSVFFAFDTILKLLAYGVARYFATGWRLIEFVVSLLSMADLFLDMQIEWYDKYVTTT